MRYVSIENLKPGDVLAEGVKKSEEYIPYLVQKGTVLTDAMIRGLASTNVRGVYISVGKTMETSEKPLLSVESQAKLFSAIQDKDMGKIIEKSKQIAEIIYGKTISNLDMYRIIDSTDMEMQSLNICEIALTLAKLANFHVDSYVDIAIASLLCNIGNYVKDNEISENVLLENKVNEISGGNEDIKAKFAGVLRSCKYLAPNKDVSSTAKISILLSQATPKMLFKKGDFETEESFEKRIENWLKDNAQFRYGLLINVAMIYEKELRETKNPLKARNKILEAYKDNEIYRKYGELLYKNIPVFPVDTPVMLSNGDPAIVIQNTNVPERPIIKHLPTGKILDLSESYLNITITQMSIDGNIIDLTGNDELSNEYGSETVRK